MILSSCSAQFFPSSASLPLWPPLPYLLMTTSMVHPPSFLGYSLQWRYNSSLRRQHLSNVQRQREHSRLQHYGRPPCCCGIQAKGIVRREGRPDCRVTLIRVTGRIQGLGRLLGQRTALGCILMRMLMVELKKTSKMHRLLSE